MNKTQKILKNPKKKSLNFLNYNYEVFSNNGFVKNTFN